MSETITYLEMNDLSDLRLPQAEPCVPFEVRKVKDSEVNRRLYEEIGEPHNWVDRLRWTPAQWRRWSEVVETWVVVVDDEPAGYAELRAERGSTLISIFGLRESHRGVGLGGALLTHAIRRGFELSSRVWVTTNTMDGEHALANYEARGMRPFRREEFG